MTETKGWTDWTEPLQFLLYTVSKFLKTVKSISDITNMPVEGKCIGPNEISMRKCTLSKALAAYINYNLSSGNSEPFNTDFLKHYVYVSSVYKDALDLACEYIGENEHQMDLHGDEFSQTKESLLEDFVLYIEFTPDEWHTCRKLAKHIGKQAD